MGNSSSDVERTPGGYIQVFFLSYPVVITMFSQTLVGLFGTMMVGRIETSQLGAAGLGSMVSWTFLSLFNGIISSASTFVSQSYGARQYDDIGKIVWHYIYIALFSYVILLILSFFSKYILRVIGASSEVESYSLVYLRIQLFFAVGNFISFVFIGFFRGIGDTKTPMYITIFVSVFNILTGYLLIFGKLGFPRLEVAGVSLANGVSSILSFSIYLSIYLSKKNHKLYSTRRFYHLEFDRIRRIIRIGFPAGIQFLLDNFSFSVFFALIARMGDTSLAASNTVMTLMTTSFMPMFGISVAATTLVGQFIGSNNMSYARKSGYTAIKLGASLGALIAVVFLILSKQLISLISKDAEVVELGSKLLMMISITRLTEGFGVCSSGSLRGAGDTRFPMLVGLTGAWLIFIPFSYLLGYTFGGGVFGSWIATILYILFYDITVLLRFRGGKWANIRI